MSVCMGGGGSEVGIVLKCVGSCELCEVCGWCEPCAQ